MWCGYLFPKLFDQRQSGTAFWHASPQTRQTLLITAGAACQNKGLHFKWLKSPIPLPATHFFTHFPPSVSINTYNQDISTGETFIKWKIHISVLSLQKHLPQNVMSMGHKKMLRNNIQVHLKGMVSDGFWLNCGAVWRKYTVRHNWKFKL